METQNNIDFNGEEFEEEEIVSEEPQERLRIQLTQKQMPLRIDKFLMNRVEGATRNKIQQAIENGFVLVNGLAIKANYKVRPLDEIIVFETRKVESTDIIPENIALDIIYEDEDLMIVNKPAGMVVHPGSGNYTGTLVNGLAWYLNSAEDKSKIIELPRIGLVHRIDKDTSGILLIGKNEESVQFLAAQFKDHSIHRKYIALAWGDFAQEKGTIEAHIGRNLRYRKIMAAFPDGSHGKHAITHYQILERLHYVSLLEFQLETGRTHQIRVHAQLIGHPLFGDKTYGGDRIVKGTVYAKYKQFVDNCFKILPRQALHAKELGFIHPRTKEKMFFTSDLPEDFRTTLEKWRQYAQSY